VQTYDHEDFIVLETEADLPKVGAGPNWIGETTVTSTTTIAMEVLVSGVTVVVTEEDYR
jgi:hypothetical protein